MATTHIDTNAVQRKTLKRGHGEVAEIVNRALCGAQNVLGMLRWLKSGEEFAADRLQDKYQLFYFMEGDGVIGLGGKNVEVRRGGGVFLNPTETASIHQAGDSVLKVLHLVVPKIDD